jgi:hypothetical protein
MGRSRVRNVPLLRRHERPRWISSLDAPTCAIAATGDPRHLRDNLQAGFGTMPDEAMRERIARAALD